VSIARLEDVLRNFQRDATLVKRGDDHETWRFEFDRKSYHLYFWPRESSARRPLAGVNPAQREFFGLQTLQKASVPSPRAIAQLAGFRIGETLGDAVIVDGLDPWQRLDELLLDHELRAQPVSERRHLALQVRTILHQLGRAGLGYECLSLRDFIVSGRRVLLRGGRRVRRGGMRQRDVMRLAHEASRFATRSELVRAWRLLMPETQVPRRNPLSPSLWRRFTRSAFGENEQFGRLSIGEWTGVFTKRSPHARRWATSSRLGITHDDWQREWPRLLERIGRNELTTIKSDPSGDVFVAQVTLAGQAVQVIVKRPKRKLWYRYVLDLGRAARARRTWRKAWQAIVRNLPTEWPLLLMEKRAFGYVTDGIIIFERVPGTTLYQLDLDTLSGEQRETLFHRAGGALRRLERSGLAHYDAKSTNWIVHMDERLGPMPIMIDLDGIRPLSFKLQTFGIRRLLRAMRQHAQYTPADSLALCRGFAPFSPIPIEEPTSEPT
jgi:hypothetical protein